MKLPIRFKGYAQEIRANRKKRTTISSIITVKGSVKRPNQKPRGWLVCSHPDALTEVLVYCKDFTDKHTCIQMFHTVRIARLYRNMLIWDRYLMKQC